MQDETRVAIPPAYAEIHLHFRVGVQVMHYYATKWIINTRNREMQIWGWQVFEDTRRMDGSPLILPLAYHDRDHARIDLSHLDRMEVDVHGQES